MPRLPLGTSLLLLFVAAVTGLWIRESRRRAARRKAPPPDRCVVCDSSATELVAPGVVRCPQCGIATGDGMEAWNRQRRLRAIQDVAPAERMKLALRKLREAMANLDTARGYLDEAVSQSRLDLAGLTFDRGRQKQQALGTSVWHMGLAHQLAQEAAELAGSEEHLAEPPALEDSALLLSLDTSWFSDGLAVNLGVHARIKGARRQLETMQAQVEALIVRLAPQSTK